MLIKEEKYIDQFRSFVEGLAHISENSFSQLISLAKIKLIKKGEYLLHIGHTARNIHFVCEGVLISQYIQKEGNVHIKNFFVEGKIAASKVSLLLSKNSSFSIQALEDSVVIEMNFKNYKQVIFENVDLLHFYVGYLEQQWVISNEKRQISFATQMARERYLTFLEEYPTLDKRVSQHHIASYLGITPTQLSRIRKDLKK